MEIIQGTGAFKLQEKSAVAIGKFDGIHLGHRKLLQLIINQKEQGLKAVVFTFDPAPSVFFRKIDGKELMTKDEKRAAFFKLGVDLLIEYPFNHETAVMLPEDFISHILVEKLNASYIAAGTDISFGDRGAGNYRLLNSMAEGFHYETQIIDKVCFFGREVSSSYIREEVECGHMEQAARLLGGYYFVSGRVQYGNQFGRTMGMPTANLIPEVNKLLPPNGVYFSQVSIGDESFKGITNIGCKPTVSDQPVVGVETYIYDFSKVIYGEEIIVSLLAYHREEKKYSGKEELKAQLERDLEAGDKFHSRG